MATLLDLQTRARQLADMVNSQFVSDSELTTYINESYAYLYDMLVSKFEDYFISTASYTVATPNSTFSLPSDFYKLRGLDKLISGSRYVDVPQFMFSERNRISGPLHTYAVLDRKSDVRYRILNDTVHLLPEENAAGTYKMWYVPQLTKLATSTDETVNLLYFEDFIPVDVAIKMLAKEETVNEVLIGRRADVEKKIDAMAANRTMDPQKVQDVTKTSFSYWEW